MRLAASQPLLGAVVAIVLLALAGLWWIASKPQTLALHVIAGQSNAQGVKGDAAGYPEDTLRADAGIPFYYQVPGGEGSGGWTILGAQRGFFPSGYFGPEVTFARSLKASGASPAVFKFSKGSTSLARDWRSPGEGGLYDTMCADLERAIALLKKEGRGVELRSLVWLQGESDAETPGMAAEYHARLGTLIDDFRRRFAVPDLPVILGVDEEHPWVKANDEVAAAQKRLADEGRFVAFCGMTGLEKADTSHLTPRGLAGHGKRLFDIYAAMAGGSSPQRGSQ